MDKILEGLLNACRQMNDLAARLACLSEEHKAATADTAAQIQSLQDTHHSFSEEVDKRLLNLDDTTRVLREVDMHHMNIRLHDIVRKLDETDIVVKYLQNKVRAYRRSLKYLHAWAPCMRMESPQDS
jgi:hypothetical protein